MNKITLTTILTLTGLILSGCGLANGHGEDNVNISDLNRGYIVDGYFDNNKHWHIYFCKDRYGVETDLLNIGSKDSSFGGKYRYNGEAIIFAQKRPSSDNYEMHTGANKSLELQGVYTFSQNNKNDKQFTIYNISKDSSANNYVCKE